MSRPYEIVYIFDSVLEEPQVSEKLQRFHDLLKSADNPEPVKDVNHWGKRTLAYAVKGREVGYYVVVRVEAAPASLPEFERAIKLDEGVIRYLVVLNDGEQPRAPVAVGEDDDDRPSRSREDD
ncbi:MAG TPA: 30S ribosomal protein S6 [Gemmatimonadales bacterium]